MMVVMISNAFWLFCTTVELYSLGAFPWVCWMVVGYIYLSLLQIFLLRSVLVVCLCTLYWCIWVTSGYTAACYCFIDELYGSSPQAALH